MCTYSSRPPGLPMVWSLLDNGGTRPCYAFPQVSSLYFKVSFVCYTLTFADPKKHNLIVIYYNTGRSYSVICTWCHDFARYL